MRNTQIDILRFIGLSMIVLAHVDPPSFISQMRTFDVPLMVIVSGMAFSYSKNMGKYGAYLWGRFKRLIFPVWIFISFYFIFRQISGFSDTTLNLKKIIETYALMKGIGYVWIIRVFVLVAVFSNISAFLAKRIQKDLHFILIIIGAFLLYEATLSLTHQFIDGVFFYYFSDFFYYGFIYSIIFTLGVRLPAFSKKTTTIFCLLSFLTYGAFLSYFVFFQKEFVSVQNFKYPPSAYYYSYGILVSILLWLFRNKLDLLLQKVPPIQSLVLFAGRNSIWIYLWHIPIIDMISFKNHIEGYLSPFPFAHYLISNFLSDYFFVYGTVLAITAIQRYFITKIVIPRCKNVAGKKNIEMIFCG